MVWFRARRQGWLRGALFTTLLIACVLTVGHGWVWCSLSRGDAEAASAAGRPGCSLFGGPHATASGTQQPFDASKRGDQATAAATLLLALPAVLATLLVRPSEHDLVAWLLRTARIVVAIAGAVVYLAAITIILVPAGGRLRAYWLAFFVLGWLCLLAMSMLYWRPSERRPKAPTAVDSDDATAAADR